MTSDISGSSNGQAAQGGQGGAGGPALSALLHEERRFEPPAELASAANIGAEAYEEASRDRLAWWAQQAERLQWDRG